MFSHAKNMANQLDKYATPKESIAAMIMSHPAYSRIIVVAQKDRHLWHRQILQTTPHIACGKFKWTASVQHTITAMAITIIMLR